MDERADQDRMLRELALRVAALEDNVAFLEVWCEEHEDALDRMGESVYYWRDDEPEPVRLHIVDLREDVDVSEETEHQRKIRQLLARIIHLRSDLVVQNVDEFRGDADADAVTATDD